jgi:hypothetical protein
LKSKFTFTEKDAKTFSQSAKHTIEKQYEGGCYYLYWQIVEGFDFCRRTKANPQKLEFFSAQSPELAFNFCNNTLSKALNADSGKIHGCDQIDFQIRGKFLTVGGPNRGFCDGRGYSVLLVNLLNDPAVTDLPVNLSNGGLDQASELEHHAFSPGEFFRNCLRPNAVSGV